MDDGGREEGGIKGGGSGGRKEVWGILVSCGWMGCSGGREGVGGREAAREARVEGKRTTPRGLRLRHRLPAAVVEDGDPSIDAPAGRSLPHTWRRKQLRRVRRKRPEERGEGGGRTGR
jgi:hypothetical protein